MVNKHIWVILRGLASSFLDNEANITRKFAQDEIEMLFSDFQRTETKGWR